MFEQYSNQVLSTTLSAVNESVERSTNEKSTNSRRDTNHVAKPGCSPLSELLLYPSSSNQKVNKFCYLHLTSTGSLALCAKKMRRKKRRSKRRRKGK